MRKATVLAGGGLTSWFACGHLLQKGYDVEVLFFDVGDVENNLRHHFIDVLRKQGIMVTVQDRKAELARFGLEIARFQGRYPNGYWNTTSVSRACFAFEAVRFLRGSDAPILAHGCVAFGNDQRRMDRLFQALDERVDVYPVAAEIQRSGANLSRTKMIEAIGTWFGFQHQALDDKIHWSIDGSILGCAHEGAPIENMDDPWRAAPFLMTADPFEDTLSERVTVEIEQGRVVRINNVAGSDLELLVLANTIAGRHGIGRIGVMEDKISGNKCRGVYEAPGISFLGECFTRLYEAIFPAEALHTLKLQSSIYAGKIYGGEYYTTAADENRQSLEALVGNVSGALSLLVRGGYMEVETINTLNDPGSIERRFQHGGTAWANVPLVTNEARYSL